MLRVYMDITKERAYTDKTDETDETKKPINTTAQQTNVQSHVPATKNWKKSKQNDAQK